MTAMRLGNYSIFMNLRKFHGKGIKITSSLINQLAVGHDNPDDRCRMMKHLLTSVTRDVILNVENGFTVLTHAIKGGLDTTVDTIMQSTCGKQLLNLGTPKPLLLAVIEGKHNVLKVLLEHSTRIDLKGAVAADNTDPLMVIIAKEDTIAFDMVKSICSEQELIEKLINYGNLDWLKEFTINRVTKKLLYMAIKSENPKIFRYIMRCINSPAEAPALMKFHQDSRQCKTNSIKILGMLGSRLPIETTSALVDMSREYPVFNPDVFLVDKKYDKKKTAFAINDDLKPLTLKKRFCCLHEQDAMLLNDLVKDFPDCRSDCDQ